MGKRMEPKQYQRFKETARELGCDESEERFNEKLKQIAKAKQKSKEPAKDRK